MEIHVYDTHVKAKDQHTMHFDVFMSEKNDQKAVEYAKLWLTSIGEEDVVVSSKECRFCHSQTAPAEEVISTIQQQGYYIYQMEGCPG